MPTKEQIDLDAFVSWTRARALRTSGDIGRADVAAQEARHAAEQGEASFVSFRALLDVNVSTAEIAGASAELQIEREQRQRFGELVEQRSAELEAERAAHAETRLALDSLAKDVGQALVALTLRPGESLTEPREHAIVSAVVGLVNERHAWQRVTGCSSPEEYASRGEPTDEQVERLAEIAWNAGEETVRSGVDWYDLTDLGRESHRAGIRAVLRSLSATLPSEEEIARDVVDRLAQAMLIDDSIRLRWAGTVERLSQASPEYQDEYRARARTAIRELGAMRAVSPPSDEQLTEEAARYANRTHNRDSAPSDIADALRAETLPWSRLTPWGCSARQYLAGARREGRKA